MKVKKLTQMFRFKYEKIQQNDSEMHVKRINKVIQECAGKKASCCVHCCEYASGHLS